MKSFLNLILVVSLVVLAISQPLPEDDRSYIEFTTEVLPPAESYMYYDPSARVGKSLKFFNLVYNRQLNQEKILCYIDGELQDAFTNEVIFNTEGEHVVKYVFLEPLTDMYYIFYQDSHVTKMKFSNMDTSKVEYASSAFSGMYNLKEIIGFENLDWSSLIDADSMFAHCSELETINIGNLIGPSIKNIGFLFSYCTKLKTIEWDSVDTSNCNYMYQTFSNCYELEYVDLSGWDMSKVYYMNEIFWDNKKCEVTLKDEAQYQFIKDQYSLLDSSVKTILLRE